MACTALAVEAKAPPPQVHPAYIALRDFPGQWYVACCNVNQEFEVARRLLAKGVAYFLPQYGVIRTINRKRVVAQRPAFPGYVFFAGDPFTTYAVIATGRVWNILTVKNQARLIRDLENIQKAISVEPTREFGFKPAKGVRVRVTAGPFMGLEGVVDIEDVTRKVWIIIDMLGQGTPIDIPPDMLEAA